MDGAGECAVRKAGGEERRVSSHSGAARLDAALEELWTVPSLRYHSAVRTRPTHSEGPKSWYPLSTSSQARVLLEDGGGTTSTFRKPPSTAGVLPGREHLLRPAVARHTPLPTSLPPSCGQMSSSFRTDVCELITHSDLHWLRICDGY